MIGARSRSCSVCSGRRSHAVALQAPLAQVLVDGAPTPVLTLRTARCGDVGAASPVPDHPPGASNWERPLSLELGPAEPTPS